MDINFLPNIGLWYLAQKTATEENLWLILTHNTRWPKFVRNWFFWVWQVVTNWPQRTLPITDFMSPYPVPWFVTLSFHGPLGWPGLGFFWSHYRPSSWPEAPFAGKLSWDITTTQVNSALHPSGVAKSSTSFGWGKGGKVTSAGWSHMACDFP